MTQRGPGPLYHHDRIWCGLYYYPGWIIGFGCLLGHQAEFFFFIQAMTITADQSKAIHCEILFDQKNITQRKGEKTDGDKTGNHECAIAVTHWCLCTKTYATLCIYQPATVHSTPSIKRVSQNTMYNTLNSRGTSKFGSYRGACIALMQS